ncbi:MAG: hypothetical protein EOP50_04515 [Sphingobacteriales bacterium]|nr:MAG: hypothetical protein EOP50_04515 [Sphingobacteriales bacterium]
MSEGVGRCLNNWTGNCVSLYAMKFDTEKENTRLQKQLLRMNAELSAAMRSRMKPEDVREIREAVNALKAEIAYTRNAENGN